MYCFPGHLMGSVCEDGDDRSRRPMFIEHTLIFRRAQALTHAHTTRKRCVRDDNSVTSRGVSNPVDLRERCTTKHTYTYTQIHTLHARTHTHKHTHSRTHALDLGNITSRASMTDVTSLGDFLENHTSHIWK